MNLPESRVFICRRATFSIGRRMWNPHWSDEKNRETFGKDFLPHGCDFSLDVFYGGAVGARDGMIVNLSDMKPVIANAIAPLDNAFLPDDLPDFALVRPSAENIVKWIWNRLPPRLDNAILARLALKESARVSAAFDGTTMKITRKYEFAAAHRLHIPNASETENAELYGKCNNARGHGHNYGLEVTIEGEPDAETGSIIAPSVLDKIVDEIVYENYDHKHLNEDCAEFENLIPTSENLARVIFARLQPQIDKDGHRLVKIGLHETQKNYFEVEA